MNESRDGNDNNKWHYYDKNSEEYREGFRVWFKF